MTVDVHVDWDWAEGPNRKSRSGGMTMVNDTVVRHWSRTQASRALSTAEADYSTVVAGTAEGFGNGRDDDRLGSERADSCLGVRLQRSQSGGFEKGTWKDTRHIELKYSWLQGVTKSGRVKTKREPGEQHLADHLTKGQSWCGIDEIIRGFGGQMTVRISSKCEEMAAEVMPSRYQHRTRRDERGS